MLKSTHLDKLKGYEKKKIQGKETKNRRPRRKEPKEEGTYENKHMC